MGMNNWGTNNWVKDGLDAYTTLTGEKRADDKAQADRESQKLSNQAAQLTIDEAQRKATDRSKFTTVLQDFITMKTAADPSIPNSTDPTEIATARQTAVDLAHTAEMLNNIPSGAVELTMKSLPPSAQKVLMEGPVKAAAMRYGDTHTDPATGQTYTMTGEMGPVRIVRNEGQPAMVIPTMLAKNADGSVREVPYTEGKSNDANDPVKYVTPDMLARRAGATLTALDVAEKTGISPTVAYSQDMLKLLGALPYEHQVAWLNGEITKESTRRDKHVVDAETARAAEPYAKQIEALTGTPEEKRKAATALMIGAPSAVAEQLFKTSKSVHDLFPKAEAVQLAAGAKLINPNSGEVIADNPKEKGYKQRTRQSGTSEVFEESQDGGKTWTPVSSGPKFNPKSGEDLQAKRDIAARLRDAQRGHQNAVKTADPDTINESIDTIESLNVDAREYGVAPMPTPARPFTSSENAAIKAQAVKNLEAQRGRVAKAFGVSPSVPAINQEVRRLKQTVKPGKVSFGDPQASAATATPPPAGQHAGRTIQDDTTGKKYRSDGSRWVEVR